MRGEERRRGDGANREGVVGAGARSDCCDSLLADSLPSATLGTGRVNILVGDPSLADSLRVSILVGCLP